MTHYIERDGQTYEWEGLTPTTNVLGFDIKLFPQYSMMEEQWIDTGHKPVSDRHNAIAKKEVSTFGKGRVTTNNAKVRYWKQTNKEVYQQLAKTLLINSKNKKTVNHIDGDRTNNTIYNLEWATYSENIKHAYATGLSIFSEERKQGLSESLISRKQSEGHKRRKGEARRQKTIYLFSNKELGISIPATFYKAKENASEWFGFSESSVERLKDGKRQSINGWTCICLLPLT